MSFNRYLSLFIASLLTTAASYAQQAQLSIQLKDQQGAPLEQASVLLQHFASGKTAKAGFTGKDGLAIIPADLGKYLLTANYIGLETVRDTVYLQHAGSQALSYTLFSKTTELKTFNIVSRKKLIYERDDKFIYHVGSDSMAKSKSVSQVLGNVPFITVDGSGGVQVAGQATYKVLLNGKETSLFAGSVAQALKSFPAEIVDRIELNLAPGARFDAEGVTAIINLITKKKFEGYKGFAIAYLSDRSHFSDGLTLTAKSGRVGLLVNGQIDGTFNPLNGYKTTTTTPLRPGVYQNRRVSGVEARKNTMGSGTIELNYEIDSIRSLIGYVTVGGKTMENGLGQHVSTLLADDRSEEGTISMQSRNHSPNTTAGLDYTQRNKSNPAKEITVRFNWQGSSNRIANSTAQQYGSFAKWMDNSSNARNDEFTFQTDLTPVVKKNFTLETGAKAIIRQASADYISLFTYNKDKEMEKDINNSNSFEYRQQVYAAYGSAVVKVGKTNLRGGVRLEQTNITGLFSNLSSSVTDHYLSVIPSVQVSRRISQSSTLSASYNLHLLRPYITSLNPYVNNVDSFNISYGNPSLGPQMIHKVVIQHRLSTDKMFFAGSVTGAWSNNKILPYRKFEQATGITHNTVDNAGQEKMISLSISTSYQFTPAFRAGINGDLRYIDIRNKIEISQKNKGYSGFAAGNFSWDVNGRFNLSGSGGVSIDNVSLIGRYAPYYFYQVNLGHHIIKDRLFATMNWNNVHAGYYTQKNIFSDNAVSSVIETKTVYRAVFVGIQYTFGKLKKEVARKKGVSNDDLLK